MLQSYRLLLDFLGLQALSEMLLVRIRNGLHALKLNVNSSSNKTVVFLVGVYWGLLVCK